MSTADKISEEAAQWLIRLEGAASAELWDGLQRWLDADPRHHAAFVRLRVAWNRVDVLKNMRPLDGTIDADLLAPRNLTPAALAADGLHPLEGRPRRRTHQPALPDRRRWFAAVAVVAAVAAVAAVGTIAGLRGFNGWKSYATGIGGREEIALLDGTVVELNTNTRLRTRLTSSRRDIMLTRGEALFRVAHDPTRSFYVIAGGTVVRAVGTEFSVRIRDAGQVDVLVSAGRVAVGTADAAGGASPTPMASSEVTADETASVQGRSISLRRFAAKDLTRKLAWTTGHLAFQGETLVEAIQEFNRYNQLRITIGDPSIDELQVGGTFLTTDPGSFVAALQRSFGIQALHGKQGIRLIAGRRPPA